MSEKAKARPQQNVRVVMTWVSVGLGVFVLLFLMVATALTSYGRLYDHHLFPGLRILSIPVGGMTKEEANKQVQGSVDAALAKGLLFAYKGKSVALDVSSANPDVSRDLVNYDVAKAVDHAYQYGREKSWLANVQEQIRLRLATLDVAVDTNIDRAGIIDGLQAALKDEVQSPQDAQLVFTTSSSGFPAPTVIGEQRGVTLLLEPAVDALTESAMKLNFQPIEIRDTSTEPLITRPVLEALLPQVEEWLGRPSLSFTYEARRFNIPTSTLAGWISATGSPATMEVTLDAMAFERTMRALAPDIEREGKTGGLEFKDGKVQSFVGGTEGVLMNGSKTIQVVLAQWPATSTFALLTEKTPAKLAGIDPESLGIKELLGVGKSNFAGSPNNRRKNIAHGFELVNGTIVQPGDEFSLITVLGPIDGAHKWLPELVIKGNETKPEFGGGLCQVGTTVFRGTLNAGLPVVERRNHSYRVRYYEPVGTDATIYEPKPDYRFKNDTAHPVYLHAYIKGDDAFVEYWGTKDGRIADYPEKPRVFNITAPPPMKLIETTDLAPGKKKCTETAHAGADAEFTYKVTYANGEVKSEVFKSHYRPWQAVCLVGVEKKTEAIPAADLGSPDVGI